jgi:hypothetical protein
MSRSLLDDIPTLTAGRHTPGTGMCLMEATAAVAGELHSDRPATVHPVLAAIARVVNDAVSAPAREQLVELVPRLIGTRDVDVTLDLLVLCCERSLPVALPIWAPRLRHDLTWARRGGGPYRLRGRMTVRRAEATASLATVALALGTHNRRDEALTGLLTDAVDLVELAEPSLFIESLPAAPEFVPA